MEGNYFFYDQLEFKTENWGYSTNKDRSFYTEILKGLRPEGKTLLSNNIEGLRSIPEGTYDLGDGYYDPRQRMICKYNGQFMRELEPGEEEWIVQKCRYYARKNLDAVKLDGTDDEIIQEMIKLNTNPALREARKKGLKATSASQ